MKTFIFAMMIAVNSMNVQAAEVDERVAARPMEIRTNTEWIVLNKITRTQVKKVGNQQHVYSFYIKNGKENYVTANASENPVVHSFLFTAYLTGSPIEAKLSSPSGFVVEARFKTE